MKKLLFLITILLLPQATNAVVYDYNLGSEIGGLAGFAFSSPIMIALNVSAAIVLIISIIQLIRGIVIYFYLASGNLATMKSGKKTLETAITGFVYVFIVLVFVLLAK